MNNYTLSGLKKAGLMILIFVLAAGSAALATPPQNAILITIDTIRADHIGCYGYKGIKTPSIDSLASQGVLFERAFSPVPLTLPSHASIMTGTYPPYHGLRNNGSYALSEDMVTLAEYFQEQEYATAAFVSSFVLDQRFGLSQGFDEYNDDLSSDQNQPALLERERRAEEVTRECLTWLTKVKDEKFFLWLHYMDPHEDYHPPSPYAEKYSHNLYDGEIAYTDHWLGVLLDFLNQQKLSGNTLIVLAGDHGESLGEHGEKTHGIFIYDSTLHVPLIFSCQHMFPQARISSLVRLIDLAPTILEIMGLKAAHNKIMQGVSLVPLLQGKKNNLQLSLYCESLYPQFSHNWSPLKGIRSEEWKYIKAPQAELFHLKNDPHEMTNLNIEEKGKAKKMAKLLDELKEKIVSQAPKAKNITIDAQTRERLRSLGYVSASADEQKRTDYPDPKEMIAVLQAMDQGDHYFEQGEYPKALNIYQEIIKKDPQNPESYLLLGYIYEALGDDENSTRSFEKSLELDETNLKAYLKLGHHYMKSGRYGEGAATFKKALEINPRCITAYLNLGHYYLMQTGEIEKGREFFLQAQKVTQKNPAVHNLLALSYQKEGKLKEAILEYEKSLEIKPDQHDIKEVLEKCKIKAPF